MKIKELNRQIGQCKIELTLFGLGKNPACNLGGLAHPCGPGRPDDDIEFRREGGEEALIGPELAIQLHGGFARTLQSSGKFAAFG